MLAVSGAIAARAPANDGRLDGDGPCLQLEPPALPSTVLRHSDELLSIHALNECIQTQLFVAHQHITRHDADKALRLVVDIERCGSVGARAIEDAKLQAGAQEEETVHETSRGLRREDIPHVSCQLPELGAAV